MSGRITIIPRRLHYQSDEGDEVRSAPRDQSYQSRTRVIDDHAIGSYPARGMPPVEHSRGISTPDRDGSLESSGGVYRPVDARTNRE